MKYNIFCDESGTVKERYMVLGGIILPKRQTKKIQMQIKAIKSSVNFDNHEIKFSKLNNLKKLNLYTKVINDTYLNEDNNIHFRCVIFDNQQICHKNYTASVNDTIHPNVRGFYKQYYQLLKHQFCNINIGNFYVFLDQRSDPIQMYRELHFYLQQDKNCSGEIKLISSIDSKKSELVQLADLLVGAVSYEVNNKNRKEKLNLVEFIKTKKYLKKLSDTSYKNSFRVWRFDYNKSNKQSIDA